MSPILDPYLPSSSVHSYTNRFRKIGLIVTEPEPFASVPIALVLKGTLRIETRYLPDRASARTTWSHFGMNAASPDLLFGAYARVTCRAPIARALVAPEGI